MGIIQQWLPGAVGEEVVIDNRRFRVIKLVSPAYSSVLAAFKSHLISPYC